MNMANIAIRLRVIDVISPSVLHNVHALVALRY
jgi:hypothetical protein